MPAPCRWSSWAQPTRDHRRLIEQPDRHWHGEKPRQAKTAFLPGGEKPRGNIGEVREPELRKRGGQVMIALAAYPGPEGKVFRHREQRHVEMR